MSTPMPNPNSAVRIDGACGAHRRARGGHPVREPGRGEAPGDGRHARPSVVLLLVAPGSAATSEPAAALEFGLRGVAGDRHATPVRAADARTPWHPPGATIANTRQVSIVSAEECGEIAGLLGVARIEASDLSANLVTRGLPGLSALAPATRLRFPSGATLFVTDQNQPCRHPGRLIAARHRRPELEAAFPKAAVGRRGLVGIVERAGEVGIGDPFRVIPPRRVGIGG